ncbi:MULTISPECIES: SprT family zinc-dependent metalloprotease [unclassified Halomonas]|uniref:M48 family metallopeptidase n=1 Tax=unclassified Halomonas TaxID=2609666 RepID=UPI000D35A51F|nr:MULTISPECIES: SprT family zinc-dependent metalloprotease [unclassified Halomonas]MBR9877953.1 M48 family metallopeptidase [Gammaproteobacteria bacterium]MCO7216418.1 M48 family metallopeptidase [Halomonas sp. OfavH-34-E]
MTQLAVDDLTFEVRESSRRKTLEITVDRDGELVIAAPSGTDERLLRDFVIEKRLWIYRKLAQKAEQRRRLPQKEYVNGEGFLYLGRSYRLKRVATDAQSAPLKLVNGRFQLRQDALPDAREHFIRWYTTRATAWLLAKVKEHARRMGVEPAGVTVQDLGYRWGSCGKGNRVYFHWKTILLPRHIAEYVVVHELVHLREPHHTQAFWRRLERAMPDYEQRKGWLARHGIEVEGV